MKLKNSLKLVLIVIVCHICSGCWNSAQIEEQVYVTALGVDYVDNEYVIYAQGHNFTNLLELNRTDGAGQSSIFIGMSKGASMYEAALNLAHSAQTKLDWGQATGMIVTERAFSQGGIAIPQRFYRFPDTRFNCWFFITKSSIEELLSTGNIFDDASLSTILLSPMESYNQEASVLPLYAFQLVANINEPDRTVAIPVLSINNQQWKINDDPIPLLIVNEAYFASLHGNQKIVALRDIEGFKYLQKPARFRISLTTNSEDDEVSAEFIVVFLKRKIDVKLDELKPSFHIVANYKSAMYELHDEISYDQLKTQLEEKIEKSIYEAYLQGVKEQIDVLNVMPTFRQSHPQLWRELTDGGRQFILDEQSLASVNVNVAIQFFGKYKLVPETK